MTPRGLIEPARLAGSAVLRTQSDDRLVDLVRDGNERAFEAIVHRYRRPLLRYCGRFLSPARAEDAVQQAFVNAFSALQRGNSEIQLRPWLYRIAHNSALNVLRSAGLDTVPVDEQIDGVETPPQALERGERLRSVVAAVRDLPERQRDAIVLQAVEGRSYDEIATEMGVTDGAVRQLLNRARTTLREAATAVTPVGLLARLGGAADSPVVDRVAQLVAGAGGGAALAKGAAVLAVAGGVAGGTAGVLPGATGERPSAKDATAVVAPAPARASTGGVGGPVGSSGRTAAGEPIADRGRSSGPGSRGGDGGRGRSDPHGGASPAEPGDDSNGGNEGSGSGRSGRDGDGGDDHSGSGSSGDDSSGDDHSGRGGAGDDIVETDSGGSDDHSGPGGGDTVPVAVDDPPELPEVDDHSGGDNSGPGSGSSGRSGSGDSGRDLSGEDGH